MKFEQALKVENNQQLTNLWNEYNNTYCRTVNSPMTAQKIFSLALKITNLVNNNQNLKNLWMTLLDNSPFNLVRPDIATYTYTFAPILQLAKSNKPHFNVKIITIDPAHDDLNKIAANIDTITHEALGLRFTIDHHKKAITQPNTLTLLAQCNQKTIAIGSCSYVSLDSAINVLHCSIAARKAEYPSIHLFDHFENQKKGVLEKFPGTDYITLCTQVENEHAKAKYEQLGFTCTERVEQGFQNRPTLFYIKKVSTKKGLPRPTYEKVQEARKKIREKSNPSQ